MISQGAWEILLLLLAVFTVCSISAALYFLFRRGAQPYNDLRYDRIPTELQYSHVAYDDVVSHKKGLVDFASQSTAYKKLAKAYTQRLADAGVSHVFFVHGTFMGDDPLGLFQHFMAWLPERNLLNRATEQVMKAGRQKIARDVGNFTDEYVKLWRDASPPEIAIRNFLWSSENHHAARVRGCLALLEALDDATRDQPRSRVLLIGHSHAAQIFALVTHLIARTTLGLRLLTIMEPHGKSTSEHLAMAKRLRDIPLDFVTLGAPLMYSWALSKRHRLLHVINHRGPGPTGDGNDGLLTTRGGDYVQQLGILGSDFPAFSQTDRQLNLELDQLLGAGRDLRSWRENLQYHCRVSPYGHTLLVDYRDQGTLLPNLFSTFFGHGIYTRYRTALFLMKLTAEQLY